MAFNITYRALFEVRIIHEYLIDKLSVYWSQADAEARQQYLNEIGYQLKNILSILPDDKTHQLLQDQRMRFIPLSTGFKIMVAATEEDYNNDTHYRPSIPIEKGVALQFVANPTTAHFRSLSGISLHPLFNGSLILDNRTPGLNYPSLNTLPAIHNPLRLYKMGDSVRDNAGTTYFANKHTTALPGSADWASTINRSYLNNDTTIQIPTQSVYQFQLADTVFPLTNVKAILLQRSSQVAEQQFGNIGNAHQLALNFQDTPEGEYLLQIYDGSNLLEQRNIFLTHERGGHTNLIALQIGHEAGLVDFRLLESNTPYLRMTAGIPDPPVFEIRILRRILCWKYLPFASQSLIPDSVSDVKADTVNSANLVTIDPQKLSQFYQSIKFRPVGSPQTFDLPNPQEPFVHELGDERYYAIIHLPKLKL